MHPLVSPKFGASLRINTESLNANDLKPEMYMDLALLAEQKDQFVSRVSAIQDEKDPLSLSVDVTPKGARGTIATRVNGNHRLSKEEKEDLPAFVGRLLTQAEALAKTLLSPEEKRERALNAVRTFLNDVSTPLVVGNFEFLSTQPGVWSHEVDRHCKSSKAAKFRIGLNDRTYARSN